MFAIKESELQSLLEKRKSLIGGSVVTMAGLFLGGLNMTYVFWNASIIQTGIGAAMMIAALWKPVRIIISSSSARDGIRSLWYSWDDLFAEIKAMDKTEHEHSIIIIRDTFNTYPNRYLLYNDKRWGCWFFPNYPASKTDEENMEYIKKRLSGDLKIPANNIGLSFVKQEIHEKYSESHKENRRYSHSFFVAEVKDFPQPERVESFSIDGKQYRWMTIDAMKQDKDIQEKNKDVVKAVENI